MALLDDKLEFGKEVENLPNDLVRSQILINDTVDVLRPAKKYFAGANTGVLKITLPHYFPNTMLRFTVNLFNYEEDSSVSMDVGGWARNSSAFWFRTFAQVIGGREDVDFTVSFGHDGIKSCIWIGNVSTIWNNTHVSVINFTGAYGGLSEDWDSGWDISIATALGTVQATKDNTFPWGYWTKIKGIPISVNDAFEIPTATDPTHAVNLQQVEEIAGASGVQSVVAGTNVSIDNTDPLNPVISASGGTTGVESFNIQSYVQGVFTNTDLRWYHFTPSGDTLRGGADNDAFTVQCSQINTYPTLVVPYNCKLVKISISGYGGYDKLTEVAVCESAFTDGGVYPNSVINAAVLWSTSVQMPGNSGTFNKVFTPNVNLTAGRPVFIGAKSLPASGTGQIQGLSFMAHFEKI